VRRAQRDESLAIQPSPAVVADESTTTTDNSQPATKSPRGRIDPATIGDPLAGVPTEDRKGRTLNVIQRARHFQGRESTIGVVAILLAAVGYVVYYFTAMPDRVADVTAEKIDGVYPLIDNRVKTLTWLGVSIVMFIALALIARYGNRVTATIAGVGSVLALAAAIPFGYAPMVFGMWMMFRYSKTKQLLRLRGEWPTRKNRQAMQAESSSGSKPQAAATKSSSAAPKPSARYTPPKTSSPSARRRG